jgi:HPt (histidine-containing phosphotransfer) domain-containing protein
MMGVREEALRQLDALRDDFAAQLGGLVDDIADAWEAARASSGQTAGLRGLIELVHRLSGNAGFFGFNQVSRAAMALEAALDRWLAGAPPDQGDIQDLCRLVATLHSLAAAAASGGS